MGQNSEPRISSCMPKVFENDGYKFFFYSNEHLPIHVHVRRGGVDVEPAVELRESSGLKISELTRAEALAIENRALIIERWHEHLNR